MFHFQENMTHYLITLATHWYCDATKIINFLMHYMNHTKTLQIQKYLAEILLKYK